MAIMMSTVEDDARLNTSQVEVCPYCTPELEPFFRACRECCTQRVVVFT